MMTSTRRRFGIRRRPPRGDPSSERGMVTAEVAAALPALALILIGAIWGVSLAATQLRCVDAAREAARAAARGEDLATVREIATMVAPGQAEVDLERSGGLVTVEVRAVVGAPPPMAGVFRPTVTGRAVALDDRP